MAWLSVGSSNEDLCRKLVENDVLRDGPILDAFRATDRGDFVAEEDRLQAYADRPFKKGKIHISAPHMYATVLEALDLKSGKSFLNVGSGSGYLSCLAAFLLGEEGVSHGVEVSDFCCGFSKEKAKLWHAKLLASKKEAHRNGEQWAEGSVIAADGISFVNANCFDIDVLSAVNTLKYDRIYVGAGCPDARKEFFLSMLADNGILVVPINEKNQMLSVRKFCGRVYSIRAISNVNFAPLVDTAVRADEPEMLGELLAHEAKTLSGDIEACVRKVQAAPSSASFIIHPLAAPIVAHASSSASSSPSSASSSAAAPCSHVTFCPVQRVRLPPLVWAPTRKRHMQFPPEFRSAVLTILLANNRFQGSPGAGAGQYLCAGSPKACRQPNCRCAREGVGFLPHQLWLHVFSFANREWFHPVKSELQAVSLELAVERRLRRAAEEKLRRAEDARRAAERERDLFRIAMLRMTKRHRSSGAGAGAGGGGGGGGLSLMDIVGESDEEEEEEEEEEEDGDGGEDEEEMDGEEQEAEDELQDTEDEEDELEEEEGVEEEEVEAVEEQTESGGGGGTGAMEAADVHASGPQAGALPDAWSDGPDDSAMSLGTAENPDQRVPAESEDGDDLVRMGVYGTARSDSPSLGFAPFSSVAPVDAWSAADTFAAAPVMSPPEDTDSPYWSAYSSYQLAMHLPLGAAAATYASSTVCCASTSYGSAASGTTVETRTTAADPQALGLGSGSEERISDCTADAGAGAGWEEGSADGEGEDAAFFDSDA